MKFLNLRFFDGETIPDGGTSLPTAGPVAEPQAEPGFGDVEDFSEFDRPSPLLRSGAVEEPEPEPAAPVAPAPEPESQPAAQDVPAEVQQPAAAQPYRTLKYHGQEVPVASEDELMRLASQGLDYTQKTQRIAPYRGLIESLEANPLLMSQVVGLVQGRQLAPVSRPQPARTEVPSTRQAEKEPEWQEGESYEEYASRVAAWRKEEGAPQQRQAQTEPPAGGEDFTAKVNEVLEARLRQEQSVAVARATVADPRHVEVLGVVQGLPQGIQMAMNSDPRSYQMIYDQLRMNLFGESYFARPKGGTPPPQGQPAAPSAPQAKAPPQVQIKAAAKPAPYVEPSRGQNAPPVRRSADGLPDDVWGISDKDFDSIVDGMYLRR